MKDTKAKEFLGKIQDALEATELNNPVKPISNKLKELGAEAFAGIDGDVKYSELHGHTHEEGLTKVGRLSQKVLDDVKVGGGFKPGGRGDV
jgi:hypothetical protein